MLETSFNRVSAEGATIPDMQEIRKEEREEITSLPELPVPPASGDGSDNAS